MSSFEMRKDLFADERDDALNEIGKPTIRQDIEGHVTGRSRYYDDHLFEGLLHMRCVRSPHHHARIRSVDTAQAERMPGVRRIVQPQDVPVKRNTLLSLIGFGRDSWREVKKVVWPTRKEAMQTTAFVFAFAVVMALFLWMTDKTLEWVFYDLILGWRK